MWAFLLVVILISVVTYLTVRAIDRRGTPRPSGRYQAPLDQVQREIKRRLPRRDQGRPVAPDDDDEFLAELDRKRMGGSDSDD